MAQSRFIRWLQRLLMVVAAFGLVYLILVMIQPYRFAMTLGEKRGRVVDAETGEGLAGVAVIVNYEMESVTPVQIGHGCIHQKIVRTDAAGMYVIPNASRDIDVADRLLWRILPGFSQAYGSSLLYYKEGYVLTDELARMMDIIEGHPVSSVVRVAPYEKTGSRYVVPPVKMQRVDLTSPDNTVDAYIAQAGSLATQAMCSLQEERNSKESKGLRAEIKTSIRKIICGLPADKVLAQEAKRFSLADCASSMGLKRIREKKGGGAVLTAGDMCESYQYVPETHECQELGAKRPGLRIVTK